jgi:glycosyltransferase involved in cell wall biosynthesis
MDVVMLTSSFFPDVGGAEIAIVELSNALSKLGVNITIIAPDKNQKYNNIGSNWTGKLNVKRVKLVRIFPFISMANALSKFGKNADIIHAHFLFPSGLAGFLHKKVFPKPCVVTMHGADIQIEKSVGYGLRLDPRLDLMIKLTLKTADALIAPSKLVAVEAMKSGASPLRTHVIPNGVNIHKFNPSVNGDKVRKKLGIKPEDPVVLTLSRFHPKKGYQFLVKAIPLVIRKHPETKFIFCGKGSEKEKIVNLVQSFGISENVIFTGFIDETNKPMYYAMSDIFVLPSLAESAGIVILEALASGKPVIASNTGNIAEIIHDGLSGILIRPEDPNQIAQAIIKYLEDQQLRQFGGKVGRARVVKNYSWEYVAKKTLALYEKLL